MTVIAYDGEYIYSDSISIDSNNNTILVSNKIKNVGFNTSFKYIAGSGLYRDILRTHIMINYNHITPNDLLFLKNRNLNCSILLIDYDNKPILFRLHDNEIYIKDNLKLPIIFGSLAKEVKEVFKKGNDILFSLKQVCGINNPINVIKV